jgi:hypothetical protein
MSENAKRSLTTRSLFMYYLLEACPCCTEKSEERVPIKNSFGYIDLMGTIWARLLASSARTVHLGEWFEEKHV